MVVRRASMFGRWPASGLEPHWNLIVSTLYLIALAGFCIIVLAAVVEAVLAVSRRPDWSKTPQTRLHLMPTEERRTQDIPFIGAERRADGAAADDQASEDQRLRA